jgi:hypothetical protein
MTMPNCSTGCEPYCGSSVAAMSRGVRSRARSPPQLDGRHDLGRACPPDTGHSAQLPEPQPRQCVDAAGRGE